MQRQRMPWLGLQDSVVAQERFAQLALLVQAKRALEFGRDSHTSGRQRKGESLADSYDDDPKVQPDHPLLIRPFRLR